MDATNSELCSLKVELFGASGEAQAMSARLEVLQVEAAMERSAHQHSECRLDTRHT